MPIVNTTILGAFSKVTQTVTIESIMEAVRENVPSKPENNAKAALEAYAEGGVFDEALTAVSYVKGLVNMKKRYSLKSLDTLPITAISFLTTEGNETGEWRSQRPVLDPEKCNRCGLCWMYCPDNAIEAEGGSFKISYTYCKGCGICAKECPKGAILIEKEER